MILKEKINMKKKIHGLAGILTVSGRACTVAFAAMTAISAVAFVLTK